MNRRGIVAFGAIAAIGAAVTPSCGSGSGGAPTASAGGQPAQSGGAAGAEAGRGGTAGGIGGGGAQAGQGGASGSGGVGGDAASQGGGGSLGGQGAAGAPAGSAGVAGALGPGGGGSSGLGGSGGALSTKAATWAPIAGAPSGCQVSLLANPSDFSPGLAWGPCDMPLPGCEQLVIAKALDLGAKHFGVPRIRKTGSDYSVSFLTFGDAQQGALSLVAGYDGAILQGVRFPAGLDGLTSCGASDVAAENGRIAVSLSLSPSGTSSLLGSADLGVMLALGTNYPDGSAPYPVPAPTALANGRLLWRWGQGESLWSLDWATGADKRVLATSDQWGLVDGPVATPDRFLFSVETANAPIYFTDGVSPPAPYIQAVGASTVFPRWADGWLFWVAGYSPTPDLTSYDKLEIWGAAYDADPTKLVPKKLLSTGLHFIDSGVSGGSLRLGFAIDNDGHVVRAPDGEHTSFTVPADHALNHIIGFTDLHVVFSGGLPGGKTSALYRLPLASLQQTAPP